MSETVNLDIDHHPTLQRHVLSQPSPQRVDSDDRRAMLVKHVEEDQS